MNVYMSKSMWDKQTTFWKTTIITKYYALKIAKVISIITIAFLCIKFVGFMQNQRLVAKVIETKGNEIAFEIPNGNVYVWESDNANDFSVGDKWEIYMFDFENGNPEDDIITKIGTKQN